MQINFNGVCSYTIVIGSNQRVLLKPGKNTISDIEWDKIKNNPLVKERIAKGDIISIVEHTSVEEEKVLGIEVDTETEDLQTMNAKQAVEYIKTCTNIDHLENLLEQEKRKTVKESIKEQLKSLEVIEGIEGD